MMQEATIKSKINDTLPNGVYLPISKLHSILAIANLLAHNNMSPICYCGQIYYRVLQLTGDFWLSDTLGGTIYFAGDSTINDENHEVLLREAKFKMSISIFI